MTDTPVRFDERAEDDARVALDWYEEQQPSLGGEFIDALDDAVDRIGEYPRIYPRVADEVRRALTEKFPYSMYSRIEEHAIVVLAVLHTRRAPGVLESRIQD
jgi:plasmid stabilization system protein ParE